MKKLFRFVSGYNTLQARALVDFIRGQGPCEVEVREPTRNNEQNRLFHSTVTDIAKQVVWHGQKLPAGVWKRLLTAAWLRDRGEKPYMVPALDGVGVDVVYERTSKLSVKDMTSLIEWCLAFGAEHEVRFTTKDEP